jgi:hypothetical protein
MKPKHSHSEVFISTLENQTLSFSMVIEIESQAIMISDPKDKVPKPQGNASQEKIPQNNSLIFNFIFLCPRKKILLTQS